MDLAVASEAAGPGNQAGGDTARDGDAAGAGDAFRDVSAMPVLDLPCGESSTDMFSFLQRNVEVTQVRIPNAKG